MAHENLDQEFRNLFTRLGDGLTSLLSLEEKQYAITNSGQTQQSVERALRLQKKSAVVHPSIKR